jgi:ribosomal protein L37AE/L43A
MSELKEKEAMICRACGNEERASEGYPCTDCGTFICVMCSFRGVFKCRKCEEGTAPPMITPSREIPLIDWPEH